MSSNYGVLTPLTLRFYDAFVYGFSNRFLWRCDVQELLALYQRNISACHLDVGVGTGFFLDRTRFPTVSPSITLLDVNAACLDTTARRIARYSPQLVMADVLDKLPAIGPFLSVGLGYVMHCLQGSIPTKAVAFDHVKAVMAPGAQIFGATIVQGRTPRSWAAQRLMDIYNAAGVFSNREDTFEDLETELAARFCGVQVRLRGSVALFEARRDLEVRSS